MPTRTPVRPIQVRLFPALRDAHARGWLTPAWVRRVARAGLAAGDPAGSAGASVVVADDATVQGLNARFRGYDEVTDVLSFGAEGAFGETMADGEGALDADGFPVIDEEPDSLGEVVLSLPQAERQAPENGQSPERETALLIVHGVLHLLGHDHAEPDEASLMRSLEQAALARVYPAVGARS
jgi:probable rRNA maturation factor